MSAAPEFSIREFLFTDKGRIGRKGFWRFCLFGVLLAIVVLIIVGPRRMLVAHTAFGLLMIFPCYCVFAKRLQDLDIPGAWALLIVAVSAVDVVLSVAGGTARFGILARSWSLISNFNFLLVLTLLGGMPGAQSRNRFGPVPDL